MILKNFCPFPVNSLYFSLNSENPATIWLNTTWEKVEGKFLLGSSSSYALNSTGGNFTVKLSKANLPNVKLKVDSFSFSRGTMNITGDFDMRGSEPLDGGDTSNGALYQAGTKSGWARGHLTGTQVKLGFDASKNWTGVSTSASPMTENMGNGSEINIIPPYLAVNIWKRLS